MIMNSSLSNEGNRESAGIVFNIQRLSLHDGPGIRTTVFMKGCPLSCRWCANPESQKSFPQLMIRDIKCTGCGACAQVCPHEAISINSSGVREVIWDRCEQCLLCVDNRLILKNLKRLAEAVKIWLRIPLIHGVNDSKDHITNNLSLAKDIKADKISLFPFHEGGRSKSHQIGQTYNCPGFHTPSDDTINDLKEMILDAGFAAGIGN